MLDSEELGFSSRQGQEIFLFRKMSGLVVGPIHIPVTWSLVILSWGLKQLGGGGVMETAKLHLVPRLKMCDALLHSPMFNCVLFN
jgi:hypothetical protein